MNIFFDTCTEALEYAIQNKSFGIFHSRENLKSTNIHTHECCEIFLCVKGGKHFLVDGKIYDAEDGSLFFMNQFEPHKITFLEDCEVERYVLQVHPEFMLRFSTQETVLSKCFYNKKSDCGNKISLSKEEVTFLVSCFEELSAVYAFADDVIKQSIVLRILAQINIFLGQNNFGDISALNNKALKLAMKYIEEHYRESLLLEDVAKNAFVSVNQLCRIFKENFGTTVTKYITSKRIAEAKKCLVQGYSVSDTAAMCGFNDYANFIRTFSTHVGISPGKYFKTFSKR